MKLSEWKDIDERFGYDGFLGVRLADGKTEFYPLELLPTPKAQEAKGNASRDRGKRNLTDEIAKKYNPDGATSQLNPLFVEEMMGFPPDWLVSPFLAGEPNP